jgi:GNAT superfamily N-acetyltransferase
VNDPIRLIRTDNTDENFRLLVVDLDRELAIRDGDEHAFYAQFNKLDAMLGAVVAYDGETAVGCGAFRRHSDDTAEIKRMFVRPESRGRGIARMVLAELESWAAEHGYTVCVLETGFKQPEAIALYKRSGYGEIPNYGQYAEVVNSLCMRKDLSISGKPPRQTSRAGSR